MAEADKPVVFVDRDDTLNVDMKWRAEPDLLRFTPGAGEAIARLNAHGVRVIVITNQSGIGRGRFTEAQLAATHRRLDEMLAEHGARVEAYYYCPHHPEAGCGCRKPKTGLLERAARERGVDLTRAYMVGDSPADVAAGRAMGCTTVHMGPLDDYEQRAEKIVGAPVPFDHHADTLLGAADWILRREGLAGACPLCDNVPKEPILFENDEFLVVRTKTDKGHAFRVMVASRNHVHRKRIPPDAEARGMEVARQFALDQWGLDKGFQVFQDVYSTVPDHWHVVVSDLTPGEDHVQALKTPRRVFTADCPEGRDEASGDA